MLTLGVVLMGVVALSSQLMTFRKVLVLGFFFTISSLRSEIERSLSLSQKICVTLWLALTRLPKLASDHFPRWLSADNIPTLGGIKEVSHVIALTVSRVPFYNVRFI
jgi:hypothetical protein